MLLALFCGFFVNLIKKSLTTRFGGGEFVNVAILVVIAVNEGEYREVLGITEVVAWITKSSLLAIGDLA